MTPPRPLLCAALLASSVGAAPAGEIYTGIGFPGAMLGYAHPLDSRFTLRADVAGLGSRSDDRTEQGIRYDAKVSFNRLGVFVDWFPFGGAFRTTFGVTSNDQKLDLVASGAGGTLTVGNTTYTTTANDRFNVTVKLPSTTPYLGIGWGHQAGTTGLRFSADLGVVIGKAKVSASASGPWGSQVSQADLDRETAELRDGVAKVRVTPQATVGLGFSF